MGVTEEQLTDFEEELRRRFREMGGPDLPFDLGDPPKP